MKVQSSNYYPTVMSCDHDEGKNIVNDRPKRGTRVIVR